MKRIPQISVVIPVSNRRDELRRALTSVTRQSLAPHEVIVVDDGSTDGSADVARELSEIDVSVISFPQQRGAPAARNAGLDAASGDAVALLDSDDVWHPDKLARQVADQSGANLGCGLILCGFSVVRDGGTPRVAVPGALSHWSLDAVLDLRAGPVTCSVFVLGREALDAGVRFDESFPALQDLELMAQLAKMGFGVAGTSSQLVTKFRNSTARHVFSPASEAAARERLLDKYAQELTDRPRAHARQLRALARARLLVGDVTGSDDALRLAGERSGQVRNKVLLSLGPRTRRQGLRLVNRVETLRRATASTKRPNQDRS